MRKVMIADIVAAALGDEQVERLQSDTWDKRLDCWDCGAPIDAGETATILILRVANDPNLQFVVHAHPACSPKSEIRELTQEQIAERKQLHADVNAAAELLGLPKDDEPDVDIVATVLDTGKGSGFPVALISHRAEILLGDGPDRVDGLVSVLLEHGWELFSDITTSPTSMARGWSARFTHEDGYSAAPGLFEVISPFGEVETSAYVQPARLWRPALVRSGHVVLVQGSRFLADWDKKGRVALKKAARAGGLVATAVPVQLVGPGNDV